MKFLFHFDTIIFNMFLFLLTKPLTRTANLVLLDIPWVVNRSGNTVATPRHLACAMANNPSGIGGVVIRKHMRENGVSVADCAEQLCTDVPKGDRIGLLETPVSSQLQEVLSEADRISNGHVTSEHLLRALATTNSIPELKLRPDLIEAEMRAIRN